MAKIYTRTGDAGETALWGGRRVRKDDVQVEAYGTVDELNAALGLVCAILRLQDEELTKKLQRIQQELFVLGAQLAADRTAASKQAQSADEPRLTSDHVRRLEAEIDEFNDALPPLQRFILPGGGEAGARLHMARTIARRAERRAVHLGRERPLAPELIQYLNRLSDWLFVAARLVNYRAELAEIEWRP